MGKKRKGRLREFQRRESEVSTTKAREQRQEKMQSIKAEKNAPKGQRKKRKKTFQINRSNVIKLAVILLIALFVFISAKNIISLKIEQHNLQQQNQSLTEEKKDLQKELDNIGEKEYIEKQARELLKMVKPNEKIFVIEEED